MSLNLIILMKIRLYLGLSFLTAYFSVMFALFCIELAKRYWEPKFGNDSAFDGWPMGKLKWQIFGGAMLIYINKMEPKTNWKLASPCVWQGICVLHCWTTNLFEQKTRHFQKLRGIFGCILFFVVVTIEEILTIAIVLR